ncbi:DUF6803 family protein [Colibacter massiliensis]|uniref:DUF6803 family protein n=1 Tax=Colibacter massiliensis TaxID=1852379 RepID=UPI0023557B9A|nr:DUF6803 family protein [Colibacter massiliensis]
MDMVMSTYMMLLGMHAPWFLIAFMVVPMALAELILCSEIFSLLHEPDNSGRWHSIKRITSITLSVIFFVLFIYLVVAVLPTVVWKGPLDILSIGFFLIAVLPAIYLLLLEFGAVSKNRSARKKVAIHAVTVFAFVAFTHLAMVFGMLDPQLGGYVPPQSGSPHHMPAHMTDDSCRIAPQGMDVEQQGMNKTPCQNMHEQHYEDRQHETMHHAED